LHADKEADVLLEVETVESQILEALTEIKTAQQEMVAKQNEALSFLHTEAEKTRKIRDEAMTIQRQAVDRVRRIGYFAFPVIILCAALIIYLMTKYRIF
jgi:hypothetical protein